MSKSNLYDGNCPMLNALNVIGGKWRLPILWHLRDGSLRYNELRRQIRGITNIMLTRSLKELEASGMVYRIQHAEVPPHVVYKLTERSKELIPALYEIRKWSMEHFEYSEIHQSKRKINSIPGEINPELKNTKMR